MESDPGNVTWFGDVFTKSSVEQVVHGPYGRNDACFKTAFRGFMPNQQNISVQLRFMSFDNWEEQGKRGLPWTVKKDEVTVEVNGKIMDANSRRIFCENGWIKYAADGVPGGIDLWNKEKEVTVSKDNCYYDVNVMVNASDGGWVNVTLAHNLEQPITDESMAFNDFKLGCYLADEEPFLDDSYDRCGNYTNGTLNPGARSPFHGVVKGAENDPVAAAEDFGGKRGRRGGGRLVRAAADAHEGSIVDPVTKKRLHCDTGAGWAMLEGTCYKVFPESELTFDQVVDTTPGGMFAFCSSLVLPGTNGTRMGASFAQIRSDSLNTKIRKLAEEYYNPYLALQVAGERRTANKENPNKLDSVPAQDLEYGWRALGPCDPAAGLNVGCYTRPCPPHISEAGCKDADPKVQVADYTNFADGFPSGKNGGYWDGKQCVYMNKDGEWQDVSCKATLEAEGVLCQTAPRDITVTTTTTTATTTTNLNHLGPCDARELESGAEDESPTKANGGGEAGKSSWTSPNGWVVTVGTPTYSNKDYYWLSNVLDGSDSCKAPWKCASQQQTDLPPTHFSCTTLNHYVKRGNHRWREYHLVLIGNLVCCHGCHGCHGVQVRQGSRGRRERRPR